MDQRMERVFEGIDDRSRSLWGHHTVRLRHTLAGRELFADASLAGLIESIEPRHMDISTMGEDVSSWGHCDRGGCSGAQVLEAVRAGRIWINLMGIDRVDARFGELLGQMYAELHAAMPGFATFKRQLGLLISSPNARVFYHFDVPGQGLWQVRGRKRIWIYPPSEPFLRPGDVENVVRSLDKEDVPYEPWFDEYAQCYELGPGDMLHWALNGPHRVQNADTLNVSLTTEHWTRSIRRSYAMNYGNGVLRREFGWRPRSRAISGPAFWAKAGLTAAYRFSGMQKKTSYQRVLSYRIDPSAPLGRVPLAESERVAVRI
jgi:hypothetical protein